MRPRSILLFAIFFFGLFALPSATHASVPFFGPIIPNEINLCPASWGMLIDVINNIISFSITIAIVFVAPIMLLYAGFLLVVNPVNASGKEHAKKLLLNTIVGIVIALASWLIIDAVMAAFYNGSVTGANGSALGTWSSLITSGGVPPCLPQAGSLYDLNQGTGYVGSLTGVTANGTPIVVGGGTQEETAICQQAQTDYGMDTTGGPDGGNTACAYAVNKVITGANYASVDGNSVDSELSVLQGGRGSQLQPSQAKCGDIWVGDQYPGSSQGDAHTGICLNDGCTQILSNSSTGKCCGASHAEFCCRQGQSGPSGEYSSSQISFWRLNS